MTPPPRVCSGARAVHPSVFFRQGAGGSAWQENGFSEFRVDADRRQQQPKTDLLHRPLIRHGADEGILFADGQPGDVAGEARIAELDVKVEEPAVEQPSLV